MKQKIFLFLLLAASVLRAQDIHYSQFDAAPLLQNPANTGVMNGDFRAGNNFKSQWKSVTALPYKTYAASYDMHFLKKKWNTRFLGAGLVFFTDKAGDSEFGTTQLNLSLSYNMYLGGEKKKGLSFGLQGGVGQRSITYSNLTWDNQYNGEKYDPALSSRETILPEGFMFPDVSAGFLYYNKPNDNFNIQFGAAAFHLNQPGISLVGSNEKMYMKYVGHAGFQYGIKNTNIAFLPRVQASFQGPSMEINAGSWVKYRLQDASKYTGWIKETAILFGGWYRYGDAVILATRFDYKGFSLGLSYDVNISGLKSASSGRGGLEFSLIYNGVFAPQMSKAQMN